MTHLKGFSVFIPPFLHDNCLSQHQAQHLTLGLEHKSWGERQFLEPLKTTGRWQCSQKLIRQDSTNTNTRTKQQKKKNHTPQHITISISIWKLRLVIIHPAFKIKTVISILCFLETEPCKDHPHSFLVFSYKVGFYPLYTSFSQTPMVPKAHMIYLKMWRRELIPKIRKTLYKITETLIQCLSQRISCKESIQNKKSYGIMLKVRNIVSSIYPFLRKETGHVLWRIINGERTQINPYCFFQQTNEQLPTSEELYSLLSRNLLFPTQGSQESFGQSNHDSSTHPFVCTLQQPLLIRSHRDQHYTAK